MDPSLLNQPALQPPGPQTDTLTIPQRIKPSLFSPRPELIDAIIGQESSGNAKAKGKKGELGLMQVRPETAALYGIKPDQLTDPNVNRDVGSKYFTDLLKRYKGNEFLALVAYNSGPGRVDKGELLPQSVRYASNILSRAKGRPELGGPQIRSQVADAGMPAQAQPPSAWQRLKGAFGNAIEGTAYADEMPAPPSGFGSVKPISASGPSAPSGFGNVKAMPFGEKLSIHAGPVTMSLGPQQTTGERTQEEKLEDQRARILQLGEEMQDLYNKRIGPKLAAGKISPVGQGLEYTETGPMRSISYENDPDVVDWITKSGQFSQALNSYYAAGGGGRGGVSYYGEVTSPHVPHPPQGLREVLGIWSPTGQQWDLKKQGEQLPILLHNLKRDQGSEGTQSYQKWSPVEQDLLNQYGR